MLPLSSSVRPIVKLLYSGTDWILRLNLVEMLYQMHVRFEEVHETFDADGPVFILYQVLVEDDRFELAASILADMTRRVAESR